MASERNPQYQYEMLFLIDGYNLIFECGLHGRTIDSQSLEKARHRLLSDIEKRLGAAAKDTTVVFDAQKIMMSGQQETNFFGSIRVLYSIHYPDADSMIEELISKHPSPKKLTVVSSDHRLQKAAFKRKAAAIDSGDWYDRLLEGKYETRSHQAGDSMETSARDFSLSSEELKMMGEAIDEITKYLK